MHPFLTIADRAARAAGDIILRHMDKLDRIRIEPKKSRDFVSEVDRKAEQEIIQHIQRAYPDHAILAEESGASGQAEYQWIIDPLDGTTNFLHGFPQFAVSIALMHKDKLMVGLVYDPLAQELFTAVQGGGARLNDRRIRVSQRRELADTLLGTGLPFLDHHDFEQTLAILRKLMPITSGIRRAGAAALDLAYVAAGRLDGFWEFGLQPWDMAAGILLVREAGGLLSDPMGNDTYFASGDLVCANPKLLPQLLEIIRQS